MSIKEINKKLSVLGGALMSKIIYGIFHKSSHYEMFSLKKQKEHELGLTLNKTLTYKVK